MNAQRGKPMQSSDTAGSRPLCRQRVSEPTCDIRSATNFCLLNSRIRNSNKLLFKRNEWRGPHVFYVKAIRQRAIHDALLASPVDCVGIACNRQERRRSAQPEFLRAVVPRVNVKRETCIQSGKPRTSTVIKILCPFRARGVSECILISNAGECSGLHFCTRRQVKPAASVTVICIA